MNEHNRNGRGYNNYPASPQVMEAHDLVVQIRTDISCELLNRLWVKLALELKAERQKIQPEAIDPKEVDTGTIPLGEVVFNDEDIELLEEAVEDWLHSNWWRLYENNFELGMKILRGSVVRTYRLGGEMVLFDEYFQQDYLTFFLSERKRRRSVVERPWHTKNLWELPGYLCLLILRLEVLLELAQRRRYDTPKADRLRELEDKNAIRAGLCAYRFKKEKEQRAEQEKKEIHRGASAMLASAAD